MQGNRMSVDAFSHGLFWDIDPQALDVERHINYIAGRVLEAGTIEDWNLLCRHLSLQGVVRIAQTLRSMDRKSLAFLSVVGRIPQERFRVAITTKTTLTARLCQKPASDWTHRAPTARKCHDNR